MSLGLSRSLSQGGSLQEQQAGRALSHRGTTQECIVCVRKRGQLGRNSAPKFPKPGLPALERNLENSPRKDSQK